MRDYFVETFPSQLQGMHYQHTPAWVRRYGLRDPSAVFFGGRNWEAVGTDLAHVPALQRPCFILCLFMVVLADQWWYFQRPHLYDLWRKENPVPKFGWLGLGGLGGNHENPFQLLWAPEREGLVEVDAVLQLLPHFMLFLFWKAQQFRYDDLMWRDPMFFLASIRRERAYQFNEGRIVQGLKAHWDAFQMERFFPLAGALALESGTMWEVGFDTIPSRDRDTLT